MILKNVKFVISCPNSSQWINDDKKEIVILGRSNVGKSTFINRLTNNRNLAKTSSTPGRTRLLNFFDVDNKYRLVDAPGYGYAATSRGMDYDFGQMMEEYFDNRSNLVGAIFLLDSRRVPNTEDKQLLDLLVEKNLPFILVATKVDKLNQSEKSKVKNNFILTLDLPKDTPIIYSTMNNNLWFDEVIERVEFMTK